MFYKFYVKLQIEFPWILLITQTNLGKFTFALPLSTQALGHAVRMFCEVVVFFTFLTQDANF